MKPASTATIGHADPATRGSADALRVIFEHFPLPIVITDIEGTILDANPSSLRLYGSTHEEMVNAHFLDLAPKDHRENAKEEFRKLAQEEINCAEMLTLTTDERILPIEVHACRFPYRGTTGLILHIRENLLSHSQAQYEEGRLDMPPGEYVHLQVQNS